MDKNMYIVKSFSLNIETIHINHSTVYERSRNMNNLELTEKGNLDLLDMINSRDQICQKSKYTKENVELEQQTRSRAIIG